MLDIQVSGCHGFLLYAVCDYDKNLLMANFIAKSAQEGKGIGANIIRGYTTRIRWKDYKTRKIEYDVTYQYIHATNYSGCPQCLVVSRELFDVKKKTEQRYIITNKQEINDDLFHIWMREYDLPLLKEFIPELLKKMLEDRIATVLTGDSCVIASPELAGKELPGLGMKAEDIILVDFRYLNQEEFDRILSELIKEKKISFTNKPQKKMDIKTFDDYIGVYGKDIVKNLREKAQPVVQVDGTVDNVVLKEHRLFASQADCVKGIKTVLHRSRYCVMNEGMGCGKTMQAAAACDSFMIDKYLASHKDASLLEAVENTNYRAIVMAPSHLVNKWAEEVVREIPCCKAIILDSFEKVVALSKEPIKPDGKYFYIISKDLGKLSYVKAPIPYQIKQREIKKVVCATCGEDKKGVGINKCLCGSRKYKLIGTERFATGLVCPECGELLLSASKEYQDWSAEEGGGCDPLTPADFAGETNQNTKCWYCGTSLWKPLVENVGSIERRPRWYKAKRYTNATKKNTSTVWLLKGHEANYLTKKGGPGCKKEEDFMEAQLVKPRKYAPIKFIKQHLKGYFEFCILDECHKYEGGATAQGSAAGWLIQTAKKTLALTGTLSGGKAEDLFYLLYRLDPKRMLDNGFEFSDASKFSNMYGCIEEQYSFGNDDAIEYNTASHGKKIGAARAKPGISPLVFTKYLIDKTVFLDLTDMSNQLPSLNEYIEGVDLDEDIREEYKRGLGEIKQEINRGDKKLRAAHLQFALSFPDKPYGRLPVISPETGREVFVPQSITRLKTELTNKERRLCEIVKDEISEGRNCFIYAEYTRAEETNVLPRIKGVLEREIPELIGKIAILEAGTPAAVDRMDWIKEKAYEGKRIIICNPALCECGLDFIFLYKGKQYNYPTIIQYQMGYNLCVLWQSVSRHYRLIQTDECRTYYLYSRDTIQLEVLKLMAKKKNAVNVLQGGGFSSEGLSAMADGIDTEMALAKALQDGIGDIEDEVKEMYSKKEIDTSEQYERDFISHRLYHEIGGVDDADQAVTVVSDFDVMKDLEDMIVSKKEEAIIKTSSASPEISTGTQLNMFEMMSIYENLKVVETTVSKKKISGQLSLF